MMVDPAVEATKRIQCRRSGWGSATLLSPDAVAAAREALAPIRAACDQLRRNADQLDPNSAIALGMRAVLDDLARHVYPSEASVAGEGTHGHG